MTNKKRWVGLIALLVAEAMNLLDATIVQVAAPVIHGELGGRTSDIQWFSAAYTLPFALLLITGGRLGDLYGRRRVFRIGVAGFVAASTMCALAMDPVVLIGARTVQGVAAAVVIPQTIGLIKTSFEGAELPKALGWIGPVMGLAGLSGPLLGGVLTEAISWRAVFLVNVPLGGAVLALARVLPESRSPQGRNLLTIEVSLFRNSGFGAALITSTLFFAVMSGLTLIVVLHQQLTLHHSVMHASLTLLPWSVCSGVASWCAGQWLVPRFGSRLMYVGLGLLLVAVLGANHPIGLAVCGVGAGLFTTSFFTEALHRVQPQETGSAAGLLNAVQQFGSTLGVVVLGTVRALWVAAAVIAVTIATAHIMQSPRSQRLGRAEPAPARTAR
jgi:MFS family permease